MKLGGVWLGDVAEPVDEARAAKGTGTSVATLAAVPTKSKARKQRERADTRAQRSARHHMPACTQPTRLAKHQNHAE